MIHVRRKKIVGKIMMEMEETKHKHKHIRFTWLTERGLHP